MKFLRLTDLDLNKKRVFIRADLNVPQDDAGKITDDTRIRASVPGIQFALKAGAAVMVTSHLGRPTEGELKPEDSLAPIAARLSELLGQPVRLVANWVDGGFTVAPGEVVLLENCRCNKGEKKNDEALAKKMAALCDVYANDAFGERGLALVVMCASGMQRESFIDDHGVQSTGSMGTILRDVRNYHWEYVRRVEAMRTNVETQYLAKNPFGHKLHLSTIPRFERNRWYRLRLIKAGNRLHGSIDGQTVFDYTDTAFGNNGPVYNFGRIALRQMYHTALRYRNLELWTRPPVRG